MCWGQAHRLFSLLPPPEWTCVHGSGYLIPTLMKGPPPTIHSRSVPSSVLVARQGKSKCGLHVYHALGAIVYLISDFLRTLPVSHWTLAYSIRDLEPLNVAAEKLLQTEGKLQSFFFLLQGVFRVSQYLLARPPAPTHPANWPHPLLFCPWDGDIPSPRPQGSADFQDFVWEGRHGDSSTLTAAHTSPFYFFWNYQKSKYLSFVLLLYYYYYYLTILYPVGTLEAASQSFHLSFECISQPSVSPRVLARALPGFGTAAISQGRVVSLFYFVCLFKFPAKTKDFLMIV